VPIPEISERAFVAEQYKDASNLKVRIDLHRRFSTNQYGWQRFVFDHLELPLSCNLLELGCGSGALWQENLDRLSAGSEITLTDISIGMLDEARRALQECRHFSYEIVDAQAIPFEDSSFDVIIANHMLYHVPDRQAALAEIRRVLRLGGRFFAATNGERHLAEIPKLLKKFDPTWSWQRQIDPFLIENAEAQFAPWFDDIRLYRYQDTFLVTEAGPLVDYIYSMRLKPGPEQQARFEEFISNEIASHGGVFHITKDAGLFVCRRK
jgi:ubiquinone/menaquinone biosynthesis C-methylase UbiE